MQDYVNTKLKIFKNLITYKRKPGIKKTAIINIDSDYSDLFLAETYDSVFTYWRSSNANLKVGKIKTDIHWMKFDVDAAWGDIKVNTPLRWVFNVENILAAIWIFISFWIKWKAIEEILKNISWIPGRMEEVQNNEWFKIFIDYAHTPDALEKVLEDFKNTSGVENIITVFWATWDRDKTKRPVMWEIVSRMSDIVILTQDDDYSEKTEDIIKDVLPGIERKEWEGFWVIPDRKEAIRTALVSANKNDIVLIAWKWDEHVLVTNEWSIEWHDRTIVEEIMKGIDDNHIM